MLPNNHGADASRPLIVGIDGRSGSGKSTLTLELASVLREAHSVSVFHLEDIYPGWNGLQAGVDRYVQNVLTPLAAGQDAQWLAWDWERHFDGESRHTSAADIVLVEGVGAAAAAARPLLDAVIWVQAGDELRKERALARDGETFAPYWDLWAAQEEALLDADDPLPHADAVISTPEDSLTDCRNVLGVLASLPACAAVLAPDTAASAAVPVASEHMPLPVGCDLAELSCALFGSQVGGENAVWLDSSTAGAESGGGAGSARLDGSEGASGGGDSRARFSIMADDSGPGSALYRHHSGSNELQIGNVRGSFTGPFFKWLNAHWAAIAEPGNAVEHLPYALGWIGYLGYELKRETGGSDQRSELPDAVLLSPGRALVIDHQDNVLWLLQTGEVDASWREQVAAAVASSSTHDVGSSPCAVESPGAAESPGTLASNVTARDSGAAYKAKIGRAQSEIVEGNSYEVCLTTAVNLELAADPLDAYSRLRTATPAPFAALLRFGQLSVLSSSPERFLSVDRHGKLVAEPIKGTRRRDADPAKDAALKAELANSAKDRAENVMIVDLMRNDLLRHAEPESLSVTRLCEVETYATVFQMVSTITAQLAPGASRAAAIAAAFPAGSMTGAPKRRTMEILDELEGAPRGPYAGAAGFFSRDGAAELSVLIRTLISDGGRASLGIGGAITADSAPEEEWQEAKVKALGVLGALGVEFPA